MLNVWNPNWIGDNGWVLDCDVNDNDGNGIDLLWTC